MLGDTVVVVLGDTVVVVLGDTVVVCCGDIELVDCGGGVGGGDGTELCKNLRCKGRGVIKVVAESLGVLLNLVILE